MGGNQSNLIKGDSCEIFVSFSFVIGSSDTLRLKLQYERQIVFAGLVLDVRDGLAVKCFHHKWTRLAYTTIRKGRPHRVHPGPPKSVSNPES